MNKPIINNYLCGGSTNNYDNNAPKEIKSNIINHFYVETNLISYVNHDNYTYISAYAKRLDIGFYLCLNYKDINNNQYMIDKLIEKDIMIELNEIVKEFNLISGNGKSHSTSGLPENFGGTINIIYDNNDYIYKYDNQSPMVSPDCAKKIVEVFLKYLKTKEIKFIKEKDILYIKYLSEGKNTGGYYLLDDKHIESEMKYIENGTVFKKNIDLKNDLFNDLKTKIIEKNIIVWSYIDYKSYGIINDEYIVIGTKSKEYKVSFNVNIPSHLSGLLFNIYLEMDKAKKEKNG